MKEYWVDFNGYGYVKAENEVEAEAKFWKFVNEVANNNGIILDDVWDCDGIEEKCDSEDEGELEPIFDAAYKVTFTDSVHGEQVAKFETFDKASDYWQVYANTETCVAGKLEDLTTGKIIWKFSEG